VLSTPARLPKRATGDRSIGDLQPKPARIRPARPRSDE
jgi:hypothetical protein